MAELHHECGIAAVYQTGASVSPLVPGKSPNNAANIIPRLLLDIQNRGQLAAGMTSFNPDRNQLLDTHKEIGGVNEVFQLAHRETAMRLMSEYDGPAAIGHVRYATCGKDDRSYAQPFERHHIEKRKWFAFGFNGQLANYPELRDELLAGNDAHLARETDTEILMHLVSRELSRDPKIALDELLMRLEPQLDGAYNIVFLNSLGEMFVSRDPLGIRPLCYAIDDNGLFAAASESVALANYGFAPESIKSLAPGEAVFVTPDGIEVKRYAAAKQPKHCFFEWIYFANVASVLDERSVYMVRKRLGAELARQEFIDYNREDTVVVPVPDTAKAAADSMAYELGLPSLEGLIRNRYVGRTFIEGGADRAAKVRMKYTPLREVLEGKRVLLVEDTIVRSTTMKALVSQLRERGGAKEVHVRVACPPITAPCFYGIDIPTVSELFAPNFLGGPTCPDWTGTLTDEQHQQMSDQLEADSLRYLPLDAVHESLKLSGAQLCRACLDGNYPTEAGRQMYQLSLESAFRGDELAGRRALDAVRT